MSTSSYQLLPSVVASASLFATSHFINVPHTFVFITISMKKIHRQTWSYASLQVHFILQSVAMYAAIYCMCVTILPLLQTKISYGICLNDIRWCGQGVSSYDHFISDTDVNRRRLQSLTQTTGVGGGYFPGIRTLCIVLLCSPQIINTMTS